VRDELQIARWRDGSDVVPTLPAALPPRGWQSHEEGFAREQELPRERARCDRVHRQGRERSERNAVEKSRAITHDVAPHSTGFLDSATPGTLQQNAGLRSARHGTRFLPQPKRLRYPSATPSRLFRHSLIAAPAIANSAAVR